MSLFGAATSGVDPQTGSYLSREQRVAMFQASRGNGGGANSGAKNSRAAVSPNNAIVVANKMTAVVQKLSSFSQENVSTVSEQVQQNKQTIEDLYTNVANRREEQLKLEQAETQEKRVDRESFLRKAKENLVEGISGAAAGVVNTGKAALRPFRSLWDKIKQALLLLGAAWVIDNLPTIIDTIKNFSFDNLKEEFITSLGTIRGAWSILDDLLRGVKRVVRGIARAAFRVARFILNKAISISRKVIGSIGRFVGRIARKITEKLGGILTRAAGGIWQGAKKLAKKGADGISSATKPLRDAFTKSPVGKFLGKVGTRLTDSGRAIVSKGKAALGGAFNSAKETLSGGLAKIQESTTGVKSYGREARVSWLKKALAPIAKQFPKLAGGIGRLSKAASKILSAVPGLGFAIDLALNKTVGGQEWTEAIIRALPSSIAGGIGVAAGAKLGGLAGAGVGAAFAGVGAIPGGIIGAGLGALIGGMGGGALGDMAGAATYEFVTGKKATGNDVMGASAVSSITGAFDSSPELELSDTKGAADHSPAKFDYTLLSSPSGTAGGGDLGLESPGDAFSDVATVVQLPPTVSNVKAESDKPEQSTELTQIQEYSSFDPGMDMYRKMALIEYQLVGA